MFYTLNIDMIFYRFYFPIILFLCIFFISEAAFLTPSKNPPKGNPPPPLTPASAPQIKDGDLEVANLITEDGMTLEGVKKSAWGPDGDGSCTWEGMLCDCKHDSATWNELAITISAGCSGGSFDGIRVKSIQLSSSKIGCSKTAPAGCTPSLYTYKNAKRSTVESFVRAFKWF